MATPDLLDYVAFFEVEPTILDAEVGWTCGAQFDSVRGEDRIRVVVAPSDGKCHFQWWREGIPRADLNLGGIVEWILECEPQRERLILKFYQPAVEYFIIELKPHISTLGVVQWA